MRIAIIGRSETLFNSMQLLQEQHEIVAVATAREAPEYAQMTRWLAKVGPLHMSIVKGALMRGTFATYSDRQVG